MGYVSLSIDVKSWCTFYFSGFIPIFKASQLWQYNSEDPTVQFIKLFLGIFLIVQIIFTEKLLHWIIIWFFPCNTVEKHKNHLMSFLLSMIFFQIAAVARTINTHLFLSRARRPKFVILC